MFSNDNFNPTGVPSEHKVKLLLTLYRPLPPPLFYLVKPKLLAFPPLPPKVSKSCTLSGALALTVRLIVPMEEWLTSYLPSPPLPNSCHTIELGLLWVDDDSTK